MKHYTELEKAMCRELEMLDKKYGAEAKEMDTKDVERADVLYHALKSAATWHAMKDAEEEWDGEEESEEDGESYGRRSGRAYARRRDSRGRYTSYGTPGRYGMAGSYGGNYGGSEDGYSGHYPEWMPPMYPRRY